MAKPLLSERARKALSEFDQTTSAHKTFVDQYERNRRAYLPDETTAAGEAARWTHKLMPPYAEHIIETTIASMMDEDLRFRVRPRDRLFLDPQLTLRSEMAARAFKALLDFQLSHDRFAEKQRLFIQQERLAGLSVMKVYWHTSGRMRKRLTWETDPVTGASQWGVAEEPETVFDGPRTEVVDVRDFFWDDAAATLSESQVTTHRTWPTFSDCKRMQRMGVWRNVDEIPKQRDFPGQLAEREQGNPDRKPGRVEVLEIWRREDDGGLRVYTVANRSVLLAERDNPFWHGELPFVAFVGQSLPFRIPGRAQMDKLVALQEAAWSIGNQRLDNLMFLNNQITILNEDLIDDIDQTEYGPGERWVAHGDANAAYSTWAPNPTPAQISIPAESMIKADMQNLAGGFPFTSTSEAQTVNASTATQASLVASLAQRSIIGAKRHLYDAYRRIGQMQIELNRQFMRDELLVKVVGADDPQETMLITPDMLDADVLFDIEPMTESLMRQERRSENLSLFQALMPTVQIGAMTGAPLNTRKLYEHVLEAFDIRDVDSWFMPTQAAAPAGQVPGMPTPPNPQNGAQGVTNPQLAAGPLAPSNGNSLSPMAPMQQFMADNTPRNA